MITIEQLLSIDKNNLQEASKAISRDDLVQLVEWLSEKDDKIRYPAFLLLQARAEYSDEVYTFWDTFKEKLKSENSYQRSIGLMLIGDNSKWDKDDKLKDTIDEYLLCLNDEKPITVRQCLQSLCKIVQCSNLLHMKIANAIMSVNISEVKETMRKTTLTDMLSVLAIIRKHHTTDEIEDFIFKALAGGILDRKAIKQVESMLAL